jgi:hypothetical protein
VLAARYAAEAAALTRALRDVIGALQSALLEGSTVAARVGRLAEACRVVVSAPVAYPPSYVAPVASSPYVPPVTAPPQYSQPVAAQPYQQPVAQQPPYSQPVAAQPYQQPVAQPPIHNYMPGGGGGTPTAPTGGRMLNYYPAPQPVSAALLQLAACLARLHKLLKAATALTRTALVQVSSATVLEGSLARADAALAACLSVVTAVPPMYAPYPSYPTVTSSMPRYLEAEDGDDGDDGGAGGGGVRGANYAYESPTTISVVSRPAVILTAEQRCAAEAAAVARLRTDVCAVEMALMSTTGDLLRTWSAIDGLSAMCFPVATPAYPSYPSYPTTAGGY